MAQEATTRRAIIGAAAGAAVAAAATAVGFPKSVHAESQPVLVGGEYTDATSVTLIKNSSTGSTAEVFRAEHAGSATAISGKSSGTGFHARGLSGEGYIGVNAEGIIAGRFVATQDTAFGSALAVDGRASFTGSGIVTVPSGKSSVIVTTTDGIYDNSFVLGVMLQAKSGIYLKAVIPDRSANPTHKFTIKLNKAVSSPTLVGWFQVN